MCSADWQYIRFRFITLEFNTPNCLSMYRYQASISRKFFEVNLCTQPVFRSLCSNSDGGSGEEKKSKRPKQFTKSRTVVLKSLNNVSPDAKRKLDSLTQSAKQFKSISPKDESTASQMIGKPKTFVRRSARGETVPPPDPVESAQELSRGLDKRLVDAARRVAKRMPRHLQQDTEKQLLDSIEDQHKETKEAKKKLMKQTDKEDYTKSISYQIMKDLNPISVLDMEQPESKVVKIGRDGMERRAPPSLFSGERLNIFDPKVKYTDDEENRSVFFEKLLQNEIQMVMNYPVENAYEETIRWTEEGKLWKFPINNEQGLEAEERVPFYEHVLLDELLVGFPEVGPVRQFMELVILGLANNPYIKVERKHDIVQFYRDFFEDKASLINIASEEEVVASAQQL